MNTKKNLITAIILIAILTILNAIFAYLKLPKDVEINKIAMFSSMASVLIGLIFLYLTYYFAILKKGLKFITFMIVLYVVGLVLSPYLIYKNVFGGYFSNLSIRYYISLLLNVYFVIFAIKQRKDNMLTYSHG